MGQDKSVTSCIHFEVLYDQTMLPCFTNSHLWGLCFVLSVEKLS